MSCELKSVVKLSEINAIKAILFPGDLSSEELQRDDDWDNRWSWDEEPIAATKISDHNSWLKDCLVVVSPFQDLIAFAFDRHLSIFKIDRESNTCRIVCGTTLTELQSDESITSIVFCPFISQQKSNEGSVDWTCVILGFSSGFLRIFTENGYLLLTQKIHNEAIHKIQLQTFHSPQLSGKFMHTDGIEQTDEIIIFCQNILAIIDGFAFHQTIRSLRNHLAKSQSQGYSSVVDFNLQLPLKKWYFSKEGEIEDCCSSGLTTCNLLDHFVSQSLKGPYGTPKRNTGAANLILSAGENPFLGFGRAAQVNNRNILEEVKNVMVNKMKNFIPRFVRSEEAEKSEEILSLPLNVGLYDQHRRGKSVCLCPSKDFAAMVDDFGRVCLVNVVKNIVVRMWKGYREAQCGWIEVKEDETIIHSKKALFLCIYAPKRGILEIWKCQQGPRVTAFNVGKNCKLLYDDYSLFGLNHLLYPRYLSRKTAHSMPNTCFLFDCSSATLFSIEVPFVCSLTEQSSRRVRDLLLFKELKNKFAESENEAKILQIFSSLQEADVKRDAIYFFIESNQISLIKSACDNFKNDFLSQDLEKVEYDKHLLSQTCCRVLQLVDLYENLCKINEKIVTPDNSEKQHLPSDLEQEASKIGLTESELARCLSLWNLKESTITHQEATTSLSPMSISDFINHFIIEENQIIKEKDGSTKSSDLLVEVRENLLKEGKSLTKVAGHMFYSLFHSADMKEVFKYFDENSLKLQSLLDLSYIFWLNSTLCSNWKNWSRFYQIVNFIMTFKKGASNENSQTLNHRTVYAAIINSTNLLAAIIGAYVIKNIQSKIFDESTEKSSVSDATDEWQTLSLCEERLKLLIKQLEDTFLLDLLLKYNKKEFNRNVSLAYLINGNPGIVTELVAKWIVESAIDSTVVANIEDTNNDTFKNLETGMDSTLFNKGICDEETVKELLGHVKACFPFSLETDILLANCSWEAVSLWDKEPSLSLSRYLNKCLDFLSNIQSAILKHNTACLIWKTFLGKRFETLSYLMEKMSKAPKDRICKKELGFGEDSLETFIHFVNSILDVILETLKEAEIEPLPLYSADDWWKAKANSSSAMPLAFIAVHQKIANFELCLLHSHLATIIYFVIHLQVKCKPLSLFTGSAKQVLFKELNSKSVSYEELVFDSSLDSQRINFLFNTTSAVAYSTPPSERSLENSSELLMEHSKMFSQANHWFGKVISLSKEWKLDTDQFRQRYVVDLFANACDSLAEDVMNSVSNKEELAAQLLKIAGIRISSLVDIKVLSLAPNVSLWLQSLNKSNPQIKVASAASTKILLEHIINLSDESSNTLKFAYSLNDALNEVIKEDVVSNF